jgi:type IV secretion system protein VirB10
MNPFTRNPTPTPTPPTVSTAGENPTLGFWQRNRKALFLFGGCFLLLFASRVYTSGSRQAKKEAKAEQVVAASNHDEADKNDQIVALRGIIAASQQEQEVRHQQELAAALANKQLSPAQLEALAHGDTALSPTGTPPASPYTSRTPYNSAELGGKPAVEKPATLVISYREQEGSSAAKEAPPSPVAAMPLLPPGYGVPVPAAVTSAPPVDTEAQTGGEREHGHGDQRIVKAAANPEDAQHELAASTGEKFRIREGTWIPCTESLRINGSFASDIDCLVSIPIYSANGSRLLIPQGTLALGHVAAVNSQNQQRLFVVFDRLLMPDGYTATFENAAGLDQIGQAGLRDQVNHHYLQMFGASVAIAAIGGLAQIGNYGTTAVASPLSQYRAGVTQGMSESSVQILNRFSNVLPTFVIREGARNNIDIPFNLWLPEYNKHTMKRDL